MKKKISNLKEKSIKTGIKKTGLPPGSIVYTGHKSKELIQMYLFQYDENKVVEKKISNLEELKEAVNNPAKVNWLNIEGLHDVSLIEQIGQIFELHSLVLEDIVNIDQRPKYSDFNDYIFLTLKMMKYEDENQDINFEHLSLILTKNFVITFQELPGNVFDVIRDRIRLEKGKVRHKSSDYLFYTLLDIIVDHYYLAIESVGNAIDSLEEEIINKPDDTIQASIQNTKRSLLLLRKSIFPLRDELGRLYRNDSDLIEEKTLKYFGDVFDHSIQIIETIESYRDINSGLMDMYLSSINHRMNQIIKVLTIISTIFIPLTFIVGIYGMNFPNIPEFKLEYGYFYVLGFMLFLSLAFVFYFKKKKWL